MYLAMDVFLGWKLRLMRLNRSQEPDLWIFLLLGLNTASYGDELMGDGRRC